MKLQQPQEHSCFRITSSGQPDGAKAFSPENNTFMFYFKPIQHFSFFSAQPSETLQNQDVQAPSQDKKHEKLHAFNYWQLQTHSLSSDREFIPAENPTWGNE